MQGLALRLGQYGFYQCVTVHVDGGYLRRKFMMFRVVYMYDAQNAQRGKLSRVSERRYHKIRNGRHLHVFVLWGVGKVFGSR